MVYRQNLHVFLCAIISGNEHIHTVTYHKQYQFSIVLTDYDGNTALVRYRKFMFGSVATKYKLNVDEYSGDAG